MVKNVRLSFWFDSCSLSFESGPNCLVNVVHLEWLIIWVTIERSRPVWAAYQGATYPDLFFCIQQKNPAVEIKKWQRWEWHAGVFTQTQKEKLQRLKVFRSHMCHVLLSPFSCSFSISVFAWLLICASIDSELCQGLLGHDPLPLFSGACMFACFLPNFGSKISVVKVCKMASLLHIKCVRLIA